MSSSTWAVDQLSQLLPLDEQSLREVLDYTSSLDKAAAADHLKNLLGGSPKALEFINSFNAGRDGPPPSSIEPAASALQRKPKKKKAPLHSLPARQIEDYGDTRGAYRKNDGDDYMAGAQKPRKETPLANTLALSEKPEARQLPIIAAASMSKLPPSASGQLISDLPNVRTSSRSRNSSRTASPAPKMRINVAGGQSMHGASSTTQDLDSAIRALEIQTNPSLSDDPAKRSCDCLATRHPLLAAAPNCLNCGKIICIKEGIGPCTFCGHALLDADDIDSMIRSLRDERGKEKMDLNNASQRRPDVASVPKPFTTTSSDTTDATLARARQHRDKLLNYQAENARRTHIIDQAADFETPTAGQSMWSSPMERAAQLKRQQKVLREQEWNAKPEYEKRRMVVSLDIKGGKAVRRMAEVERPSASEHDEEEAAGDDGSAAAGEDTRRGVFSKNPLMGSLIRPVWKGKENDEELNGTDEDKENRTKTWWRRVQDDNDDNEALLLDDGIYGGSSYERTLGDEEHACG